MKKPEAPLPLLRLNRSSDFGGALGSFFSLIVIGGIVLFVLSFIFGVRVPPGMMAVRQINFGPGQGISGHALLAGLHWRVPFYSEIHFIPGSVSVLDFHREKEGADVSFPPLEIQTSDRATVDVDVTILYRFFSERADSAQEGKHGGPEELISTIGLSKDLWINKVRRTADDALKRALGTISTQQFYDPVIRERQVDVALQFMNKGSDEFGIRGLAEQGIKIEALLLRRYTYREERIENAIFQKNLQDQEEALNVAEGKLSEAQARSTEEEARGEAKNRTLQIQGEEESRVIRSNADLYNTQKRAEADLLVARAQADIDKQRASALARSKGAEIFVAREMGPLLGSLKGGVVSNVDPYDLNEWMKRLGVVSPRE